MIAMRAPAETQRARIVVVAPHRRAAIRARIRCGEASHPRQALRISRAHLEPACAAVHRGEEEQFLHQAVVGNGRFEIDTIPVYLDGDLAAQLVPARSRPFGLRVQMRSRYPPSATAIHESKTAAAWLPRARDSGAVRSWFLGRHVLTAGDSLQSLAYQAYGNPELWRHIAEANGVDDPMRLKLGTTVLVPALEEIQHD